MNLTNQLDLKRCPHCNIANPNITMYTHFDTNNLNNSNKRTWKIYICLSCGGVITGSQHSPNIYALELYPQAVSVDECLPEKVKQFLNQSLETIHAPSGSIMLSASSIDAMLKDKGYKNGNLYKRIEEAVNDHLITEGMSQWAHQIRLEANDQRHADDDATLPTEADAKRIVEFALALAEFLYVLPYKVNSGIENTKE